MLLRGMCVLLIMCTIITSTTYMIKKLRDKYAVRLVYINGGVKQNENE